MWLVNTNWYFLCMLQISVPVTHALIMEIALMEFRLNVSVCLTSLDDSVRHQLMTVPEIPVYMVNVWMVLMIILASALLALLVKTVVLTSTTVILIHAKIMEPVRMELKDLLALVLTLLLEKPAKCSHHVHLLITFV